MATSIREALESAVSAEEAKLSSVSAEPAAEPVEQVQPAATEVPIGDPAPVDETKPERARGEDGKFVAETAREKAIRLGTIRPAGTQAPAAAALPVAAQVPVPKLPRPDSWKKERQADWDAMSPSQQAYVKEREDQYFKGVSTYKQEWEGAKPLLDAMAPFIPDLQRFGVQPAQWIASLGQVSRSLATGSPQEKLATVQNILRNNRINAQLAVQDEQGNWQLLAQQAMPQQVQPQPQQPDVATLVRQELSAARTQQSINDFEAARDAAGQPLYPHFQTVKSDMALLLDAGKAQDLKSAYTMALRLHDDLFAAEQEAKTQAAEAARQAEARKAVAAAKGNAISVKSATPASAGAKTPTTRREALEAAYDQHASGRV